MGRTRQRRSVLPLHDPASQSPAAGTGARREPGHLRRVVVLSGAVALVAAVTPVLLGVLPSASGTTYGTQQTIIPLALSSPQGVAVDSNGDVYVADSANKRVLELEPGVAWELCSKRGRHCHTIDGATEHDYQLVYDDLHHHVAVLVTAADAEKQTTTVRSPLVGPVHRRRS